MKNNIIKSARYDVRKSCMRSREKKNSLYDKLFEFFKYFLLQLTLNTSKNVALQIAFQTQRAFDKTFKLHANADKNTHAKTFDLIDREINSQNFLNHFLHSICFNSFTYVRDAKLSKHADENSNEHACKMINKITDETLLNVLNRESNFTIRKSWNKRVMFAICSAKKSEIMLS